MRAGVSASGGTPAGSGQHAFLAMNCLFVSAKKCLVRQEVPPAWAMFHVKQGHTVASRRQQLDFRAEGSSPNATYTERITSSWWCSWTCRGDQLR